MTGFYFSFVQIENTATKAIPISNRCRSESSKVSQLGAAYNGVGEKSR